MSNEIKVPENDQGEIVIYQTDDGETKIDVRFVDETVWLTQQQMADLFQSSRTNIVEHIKHIYEEEELDEVSTCRNFRQVRLEGKRMVERELPHYNLDMIISLVFCIIGFDAVMLITGVLRELFAYGTINNRIVDINTLISGLSQPFGGFVFLGLMCGAYRFIRGLVSKNNEVRSNADVSDR